VTDFIKKKKIKNALRHTTDEIQNEYSLSSGTDDINDETGVWM
jgi:hypothetical protein